MSKAIDKKPGEGVFSGLQQDVADSVVRYFAPVTSIIVSLGHTIQTYGAETQKQDAPPPKAKAE